MTTAHRPTWTPAIASKDLPSHRALKVRQPGQNTLDEISRRNLKEELFAKEQLAKRKRIEDIGDDEEDEQPLKKQKTLEIDYSIDADDSDDESSDDSDDEDSSSDSSDDEDEIRKELAKIKAERAALQRQKEQENEEANKISENERILRDNPLLWQEQNNGNEVDGDYSLEKKWYEDVVFKNQARDQPKHKKRFINDTVRNDFHRKFLNKYVQ